MTMPNQVALSHFIPFKRKNAECVECSQLLRKVLSLFLVTNSLPYDDTRAKIWWKGEARTINKKRPSSL